ncbi:hypothetical protein, partial [Micrococcus luteus]|uniref:hypothetical protein n=1 Tax=Micrococcus luteus TaxID=1270 RepID=UPI001C92DD66
EVLGDGCGEVGEGEVDAEGVGGEVRGEEVVGKVGEGERMVGDGEEVGGVWGEVGVWEER